MPHGQIERQHLLAAIKKYKSRMMESEHMAALFSTLTLSFDAKDVARGLSENAQLSLDAAIAGVNATTFSAKEGVASLLARTMSGADKRALCAAANVDI